MLGMTGRIFIHAVNVHNGGGKILLSSLLCAVPEEIGSVALLDTRMLLPERISPNISIKWVPPSVWARLWVEWWLLRNVHVGDSVLCFGNLPPLFRLQGHVSVFLQNRYLVDMVRMNEFHVIDTRISNGYPL